MTFRAITSIDGLPAGGDTRARPSFAEVAPDTLFVDEAYQRGLAGRSRQLIKSIVGNWDWRKFKPPIVTRSGDGRFEVIDGQHTAIAAASHSDIETIPVMIVDAPERHERAAAFIGHNRDRVKMTVHQLLHAEIAAGVPAAVALSEAAQAANASFPRYMPQRGHAKPGDIAAVAELRSILSAHGADVLKRVVKIGVIGEQAPLLSAVARGLRSLLTNPAFREAAALSDQRIGEALGSIADIDKAARRLAQDEGKTRGEACAVLIHRACTPRAAAPKIAEAVSAAKPKPQRANGFRPAAQQAIRDKSFGPQDVSHLVFKSDPPAGRSALDEKRRGR